MGWRNAAVFQVTHAREASILCKMHLRLGFILNLLKASSLEEDDAASPHLPICSVFLVTSLKTKLTWRARLILNGVRNSALRWPGVMT